MFVLLIFLFLSVSPFISAELNATQINNGFSCLNSKINCTSISLGEKIFASLATGQCIGQIENSTGSGCFPSDSCNIKTTSQALLALKNSGRSTNQSATWLLTQSKPATEIIDWFLQIDSEAATSCTISYSGNSYPDAITVNADKTLSGSAGCLTVSPNSYWLSIASACYGIDISISCGQPFKTTELYQRSGYPTIYVSSSSNSASADGTVENSVDSSCFGTGAACSYESSLWATLALDYAGKDISSFIPYLIVMADDAQNQQYIPYAFLYSLTSSSDFLGKLLSRQKTVNSQSYWDEKSVSGPYFDTALALLPLQLQTPPEKTSALNWLAGTQGADGCWNSGNLADTAFLLYSIAGTRITSTGGGTPTTNTTTKPSCSTSGHYCISSSSSCTLSNGNILQNYTCPGTYICCSSPLVIPSCSSQSGTICSSGQICQGGSFVSASDTQSKLTCCLGGSCATQPTTTASACELAGATCRNSCLSGEQLLGESCSLGSEVCCTSKTRKIELVWIILLVLLILLALLGIIFRKQLGVLWMRIKSKFGKGKGTQQMPPRPFPPRGPPMSFQRRSPMPPPHRVPPTRQRPTEVNDVLKRLKEVGK